MLIIALIPFPAGAHPHPSGSTDRVTPGAVRVEAAAHVEITLFDDRGRLRQVSRTYEVPLGTGSGFTVAPDGVVVTATGVVQPPGRDPRVYAANRVFAEYFEQDVPADFARHDVGGDLAFRLQACYPPQTQFSACLTKVTPTVTVFPHADPPIQKGLPGEVVRAGTDPGAPAVVKVTKGAEAGTMPTVPLAMTFGSTVESVDVMAFTGRPGLAGPPTLVTAHFAPPGSRAFKPDEQPKLTDLLSEGGVGAGVIDDRKSEIVALISGGGDTPITVATAQEIRSALEAAATPAQRGQVDGVYETALAHYHNRFYTDAIPVLQQVLRLRPDHAVAAEHLRTAKAKQGTAQDAGRGQRRPAAEGGFGLFALVLPAVGLLAVFAVGGRLIVVRRRRTRPGGAAGPSPGDPAGASPGVPPKDEAAETSLDRILTASVQPSDASAHPYPARPVEDGSVNAQVKPERYCTKCGLRLAASHEFCGFCGHPAAL